MDRVEPWGGTGTAPDDIDLTFAPRPRAGIAPLPTDGELVLLGPSGQSAVLNSTGTLIWELLDGVTTLADLVDDITEVFGGRRDEVEQQIVDFARSLACATLLEDGTAPGDVQDVDQAVDGLPVGTTVEPMPVTDLDGTNTTLEPGQGREMLLVHWSPTCRYCAAIAPALATAQGGLHEQGTSLVFLTDGDRTVNRRLFDQSGLHAPAIVPADGADLFAGLGTPAAYLLDRAGRVAEPLVYGAAQVRQVAESLADPSARDVTPVDPDIRYLPAPRAVCGAGGGGIAPDEWAGTGAYRFGDFHVGITHNSQETADVVDRLFPGARTDDPRVPENYAVVLHRKPEGRSRALNLLVFGGAQVVRSRSVGRVLGGLVAYLSAELAPSDPALLRASGVAVERDGEAMVLPRGLRAWIKDLQPRLARRGMQFVDMPFVLIDPTTRELVVPEPTVDHDPELLSELSADGGREAAPVTPGRYGLRTWFASGVGGGSGPVTLGEAVTATYPLLRSDHPPASLGAMLAGIVERVPVRELRLDDTEAVARQLDHTLGT